MIPLQMIEGGWADYRAVRIDAGRRSEDLIRVQCVGRAGQGDDDGWLVEMIPLREVDGGLEVVPGEGVLIRFAGRLLQREGDLVDLVERVVSWEDGQAREMTPAEWRDDPLVSVSLAEEFEPETTDVAGQSIRVVAGLELSCDQFEMVDADTQVVALPRGRLEQISRREVTVAINSRIPFLGIAYAAERTRAESRLDPPSERFPLPAPTSRVETMELIGFGNGAVGRLHLR